MRKISEVFKLGKSQRELDFINIDLDTDTALFIDPQILGKRQDRWSQNANGTLTNYFQYLITLIRAKQIDEARDIFSHLGEPNETKLGLSKEQSQGRGMGPQDTAKVFEKLLKSNAIQTGLVEDIEDTVLFVDKIGKDKISDMITNIIRRHLIDYTIDQCDLFEIPLTNGISSGFYWNTRTSEWEQEFGKFLVVDDKKIMLVPKTIVCYHLSVSYEKFHQHDILNYLKADHIKRKTAFVKYRKDNTRYVIKKELTERVAPKNKEFIRKFALKHPEILQQYKGKTKAKLKPLDLKAFEDFNIKQFCDYLIQRLEAIPAGRQGESRYHNYMIGLLDFLFYPDLIAPKKEEQIHDGRKRIDITFDNAAERNFFFQLHNSKGISSQYIIIECKNYSEDPHNPELDQLSGRFSPNKGRFGILACRTIDDKNLFLERCKDTYKDDRGLILFITDEDITKALSEYTVGKGEYIQNLLSEKMRMVMMG